MHYYIIDIIPIFYIGLNTAVGREQVYRLFDLECTIGSGVILPYSADSLAEGTFMPDLSASSGCHCKITSMTSTTYLINPSSHLQHTAAVPY